MVNITLGILIQYFPKNVIINYLNNEITGEYLDFSLERNSLLMTKKGSLYKFRKYSESRRCRNEPRN
jgi:hypothetical protein